ncbi:disease resistance protein RUN1-like [Rhodamnia argentea]|uniref:Disease resistance protein RUN1-like n=1 Tax=Rhodamnia argentea TaxID=178133 RepID=A0A8B8PZW6_9MYRT|nr:disease resistance protein RUN1-like [Rhodamnia argentea]
MWDACGFFPEEGIEVLRFMSLIKIGDYQELLMHDQLRDLGREIVHEENRREPRNRSRLWDSEEVKKVLKENKGTRNIEAIDPSGGSSKGFGEIAKQDDNIYTGEQFKNLTSLRFLRMEEGAHLDGDFKDSMEELKWLRWPIRRMNFKIEETAKKLKFLDLSFCKSLENTEFLSAFKNLEVLILNFCGELRQIDSSIGDMKDLVRLELRSHHRLTKLPEEIGKLKKLEQLRVEYTSNFSHYTGSIGSLRNLEILNIAYSGIEELLDEIGRPRNLRELHVCGCAKLGGKLPESMGSLRNLEILNIAESGVEGLPHGIGRSRNLRELHACGCAKLGGKLPESMGSLENLEILDISGTGVEELPNGIGRPRKLRDLNASYCEYPKGEASESMCNLSSLQRLDFLGCESLQSPPDLPSNLTYLRVTCQSRKLPSLSHLTRLKELEVICGEFIECIQELPSTLLKNSECSQPTGVEESELPQSQNTPFKLEILKFGGCESIEILDVS